MERSLHGPVLLIALILGGCAEINDPEPEGVPGNIATDRYEQCKDPRPISCAHENAPVCAVRDTGIRCITTPCDSSEFKSYANACLACSDPAVNGYLRRPCSATAIQPRPGNTQKSP